MRAQHSAHMFWRTCSRLSRSRALLRTSDQVSLRLEGRSGTPSGCERKGSGWRLAAAAAVDVDCEKSGLGACACGGALVAVSAAGAAEEEEEAAAEEADALPSELSLELGAGECGGSSSRGVE